MASFLEPSRELAADAGLALTEQVIALAHGYATLDADSFLSADRVTEEPTAARARRAARAVVAGNVPAGARRRHRCEGRRGRRRPARAAAARQCREPGSR